MKSCARAFDEWKGAPSRYSIVEDILEGAERVRSKIPSHFFQTASPIAHFGTIYVANEISRLTHHPWNLNYSSPDGQ